MDRCEACENAVVERYWFKQEQRVVVICDPCLGVYTMIGGGGSRLTQEPQRSPTNFNRRVEGQNAKLGKTQG